MLPLGVVVILSLVTYIELLTYMDEIESTTVYLAKGVCWIKSTRKCLLG
jgi:hypothetical protein